MSKKKASTAQRKARSAPPHCSASLFQAAKDADWMQVVLNQGPPCFHLEGGSFCLRAQRWHDAIAEKVCHKYVSLEDLLRSVTPNVRICDDGEGRA